MKLSQLIEHLETIRQSYGELDVVYMGTDSIEYVEDVFLSEDFVVSETDQKTVVVFVGPKFFLTLA